MRVHIECVHFATSEQNLLVEAMIENVFMRWEEVEDKRKKVVLVEGIKEEIDLTRKPIVMAEGTGRHLGSQDLGINFEI